LKQDGLKWQQRAKENWLKHEDKITKYFYACANNQRRRVNQITKILDEDGVLCITRHLKINIRSYLCLIYQREWRNAYLQCSGGLQ